MPAAARRSRTPARTVNIPTTAPPSAGPSSSPASEPVLRLLMGRAGARLTIGSSVLDVLRGGSAVGRWTCDLHVAGSILGW